jgi:hypothetical protein
MKSCAERRAPTDFRRSVSELVDLVPNFVSRCAGKIPTQHARDTATSDCRRPLTNKSSRLEPHRGLSNKELG